MVAISLYRGNLHRVSDAPREWPMPPRALTLEQFRILTRRRDQSLARLAAQRSSNSAEKKEEEEEGMVKDCSVSDPQPIKVEGEPKAAAEDCEMIDANLNENSNEKALDADDVKGPEMEMVDAKVEMIDANAIEKTSNDNDDDAIKGPETGMNSAKVSNTLDADKEKRKVELEKKLEVLNQKKHHLVQMLKQILNAEEEIKRRNAQAAALRASIPPPTETAADMGSATRHVPKLSVEVNFSGDLGAESDPTASHSAHGRQMHYMHSASPSAARPFQQNTFLLPTTKSSLATSAAAAVTASPSRFAPHASSPSPAAAPAGGGSSSVFRDPRLTSPR